MQSKLSPPYDAISATQVAEILGVHPVHVSRLAERGDIHSIRTPLGRVYLPSEVDRAFKSRRSRKARRAVAA